METRTLRAVNIMAADVILIDGRAAKVIEARHRWPHGRQMIRITYRDANGHLQTFDADPEARFGVIRIAVH